MDKTRVYWYKETRAFKEATRVTNHYAWIDPTAGGWRTLAVDVLADSTESAEHDRIMGYLSPTQLILSRLNDQGMSWMSCDEEPHA